MYYSFIKQQVLRFRHFCHRGYAAFASMHREVTIGHVSRAICDLELLKSGKSMVACTLLACAVPALADAELSPDETGPGLLTLTEVEVTASAQLSSTARPVTVISRSQLSSLSISSVAEVLKQLPGVDVRQRGATGVQSDISLRGCTADQTIVMLNGINITDAQTGHYSMDIPLTGEDIERIEVYASTATGLGAYAGVVNIVTRRAASERTAVDVSLRGGEYGLFAPSVGIRHQSGELRSETSAGYNQSTGFIDNTDYYMASAYSHLTWRGWEAQAGVQFKNAGANAFYALAYPNQFDATRTAFASVATRQQLSEHWLIEGDLSYRAHFDRFELFREGTEAASWYTGHNRHWTHTGNADVRASYRTHWGTTTAGVTVHDTYITSNTLGEHNRLTLNYYAQQMLHYGKVRASLLVGGTYNSAFGSDWAVSFDMNYQPAAGWLLYMNAGRALRLPTFTDLYYHSATQLANPALRPEHAVKAEIGGSYGRGPWQGTLSVFYRYGTDVIDWVKLPEETQWQSLNMTDLHAAGGQLSFGYTPQEALGGFLRSVRVSYAYTYMDKESGAYLSKYALDYLRHHAVLTIDHTIWRGLGACWQLSVRDRNGSFQNREGDVEAYRAVLLLDGKVYYDYAWNAHQSLRLALECTNMTNQSYYDIGGILQPSHWVKGSITVRL